MRTYHFMRLLSARHRVQLICPGSVREELQLKNALSPWCNGVFCVPYSSAPGVLHRAAAAATSLVPDIALRMRQPGLGIAVQEQAYARRVDVVHIVGLEAAASVFPTDELDDIPLVLDALNAEYVLQERAWQSARREPRTWTRAAFSWLQSKKLSQYEVSVGKRMSGIIATSQEDLLAMERIVPGVPATVVANGVDTDQYDMKECEPRNPSGPTELLFTGTMDYRPNIDAAIWFADQVLPRVRVYVPNAKFVIMGRNPTPEVQRLAGPNVTVTGAVADDVPYFHRASAFVLPMRFGGGTRLKLLQAMSCGLPVVTTTMGASGIDFEHGSDGLVANTAEAFAEATVSVLRNEEMAHGLGMNARSKAMVQDWAHRIPQLESFYLDVLTKSTASMRRGK